MPRYDYRCQECEAVTEVTHGFDFNGPLVCECCHGIEMHKLFSRINIAPSATPTRAPGGIDLGATQAAEKAKSVDMAAYKRLRKDGVQPPGINGSARLEAKAESHHEVNSGHTFATSAGRKRSLSLLDDLAT